MSMQIIQRIAIHSVPRSGSTWLGTIFNSHPKVIYKYQPLFSYAFKERLSNASGLAEIHDFFNELALSKDDFLDQKGEKEAGIIPEFQKERPEFLVYKEVRYHYILHNLLEKDSEVKVVGLIRNPLSVISSWLRAPKEFRLDQGWSVEEEWRLAPRKNLGKPEEYNGYEKWKEVLRLFEKLNELFPTQFLLVNYDDLLRDKAKMVEEIFSFCGLEILPQVQDFIHQSSSTDHANAYSVYKTKSKIDDLWREHLPKAIREEILNDQEFKEINERYKWV